MTSSESQWEFYFFRYCDHGVTAIHMHYRSRFDSVIQQFYAFVRTRNDIIYLFTNLNGCTVEVCEWISNFIPRTIKDVIIYRYYDWSKTMVLKGHPDMMVRHNYSGDETETLSLIMHVTFRRLNIHDDRSIINPGIPNFQWLYDLPEPSHALIPLDDCVRKFHKSLIKIICNDAMR